jgi:CSLREA domain-containing protein
MSSLKHRNRARQHLHLILVLGLLSGVILSAWPGVTGQASTTIVVNGFEDGVSNDGTCTLREAVISANKDQDSGRRKSECQAGSGTDTIQLEAGTYILTRTDSGQEDSSLTGDLDISTNLTIIGAGAGQTIIQAQGFTDRVFHILSGEVTLVGLTIRGGNTSGSGGALLNLGSLTLVDVELTGNAAAGFGGGLNNSGSSLTIEKSSISGNTAGTGGGIHNGATSRLEITNSTVSGNSATHGGGISNEVSTAETSQVSLRNVTVSGNSAGSAGGGIDNSGNFFYQNTIVAGNTSGGADPDCRDTSDGSFYSLGNNLTGSATGCPVVDSDVQVDPGVVFTEVMGALQNNGGNTPTHALLVGSPALDAGDDGICPDTDQRGVLRPQGTACDIGAFELEQEDLDPLQTGPQFTVNTPGDEGDGTCTQNNCTFREALMAAGGRVNDETPDSIIFLSSVEGQLQPLSALPEITDPVTIIGTGVILDGSLAGEGANGLAISGGGSTVTGPTIQNFDGHGILLSESGGNTIQRNTITQNGGAGVYVASGSGNSILENSIFENGGLGIDLDPEGPSPNDGGDADEGANNLQNAPVLFSALPGSGSLAIIGRLNSIAFADYTIEFYASLACDPSTYGEGQTFLGAVTTTTNGAGNAVDSSGQPFFTAALDWTSSSGEFLTATATGEDGSTSEFSQCIRATEDNVSWPKASTLSNPGSSASVNQYLDQFGQSRWYKFQVQPGSKLIITLTNLAANFDLTVYKDIGAAFQSLNSPEDLELLGAEFAPDAFAPDAFAPDAFAPDAFAPDAFAPDAFAPDAFAPDAFAPDAFAPDAFAPDAFAPDAFAPDAFAPDAFAPDAFAPDAFAPDAFAPDAFAPDAFASSQTRSLIAISAFDGNSGEGVILNTWENDSFFYVRVRGRNGAFSLDTPFTLQVNMLAGTCANVNPITIPSNYPASGSGYKTIILTDSTRLGDDSDLDARLAEFAARNEVQGIVVNVSQDARVQAANSQADQFPQCPYAKNQVAYAIKEIVDRFAASNPLEYVVILGNDDVIPFFRHPDNALLANERNYVPPVKDSTASQASLKLGYVLSQDRYGSRTEVSFKSTSLPLPDLAVGRLVETPEEILNMLNAYLATSGGVLPAPDSVLVTGYDFMADAAEEIKAELAAGTGVSPDFLITPREISPADDAAWTADLLREQLLGSRHDLIFLAGHFSAGSALAADYRTRMLASELAASPVDLLNALVYSIGCHSGYNIVNGHAVPNVSAEPDWAQAFARKGATLIAGTGYQYGDTDFIEYSERLYLEFTRQLRSNQFPSGVPIGKALVAAKQAYLAGTPVMRGIHEKAYLEATLFGLPMLSTNLPNRTSPPGGAPLVSSTTGYASDPGATLGLGSADVSLPTNLQEVLVELEILGRGGATEQATYFSGTHGVVSNPAEPVLPLNLYNASVSGLALRGIGFQGGSYVDLPDRLSLLGSATTEVRGVHAPFYSNYFYPVKFWHANYYDALASANGVTNLVLNPTQFMSSAPGIPRGTLRKFESMNLRLYYSGNTQTYANGSTPALAAAPNIVKVTAVPEGGSVHFQMRVNGNPAAGIQEVWVTYTGMTAPFHGQWQSLYLTQNPGESTLWEGTLALNGAAPADLRYVVQAVNGVGLVSMVSNQGRYYIPGVDGEPANPSSLALSLSANSGPYGTETSLSAVLTSNGTALSGQVVVFGLGPQTRQGITDSNGRASVTIGLLGLPGANDVRASYAGSAEYEPSSDTTSFNITKQNTQLTLDPVNAVGEANAALTTATLKEVTGRSLGEKTVFFVAEQGGTIQAAVPVITDYAGESRAAIAALTRRNL